MPGYPRPYAPLLPNPVIPGDDYLNLSIWTPDPGAQGLPVLVWIHGGAFVNGSSAVPLTDGSAFARDGVVTVAINYRLGVEGFALLPDAPPNLGLLDQVAALEWVRDNIAAFGGDPDTVTVAGESAAAMGIGVLLATPRAGGLFQRAVLQSGAAQHTLPPATAQRVTEFIAAELGVPAPRRSCGPCRRRGDEALLAAVAAGYRLPPAGAERYMAAPPRATPGEVMSEIATEWIHRIPALRLAEAVPGSHVHEFGWEAPTNGLGACHYAEVPFVFDTLTDPGATPLVGSAPPRALAEAMHRAWIAFAATGDPGWPAYLPGRRAVARFGAGSDPSREVVEDPRGDLRELWAGSR